MQLAQTTETVRKETFDRSSPVVPGTIVLATDGGPSSKGAALYAAALAVRWRAHLYVFHVFEERERGDDEALGVVNAFDLVRMRVLEEIDALGGTPAHGLVSMGRARKGSPADEVVSFALEKGAGLIVAGSHQRTLLGRLIRGSVSEGIVRRASLPALVVPGSVPPREAGEPLVRRAFVAVDGSSGSRKALELASALAFAEAGLVDVGSVADAGEVYALPLSRLESFVDGALPGGHPHVAARAELGGPPRALAQVARTGSYDLLACAEPARHPFDRLLRESVAEAIVRSAVQPVLVVPA